ncbi:hypothetical protein [Piscirickettsia litoralis]|uniref:Uncharacterized protein n=1 Tax=Piscirickettsia litoralis TaxID=1891921 RepID=A0ABX2ZY35_9GAMM|nr:hypothetical protein [Piscirickettsia litoralis]ODN41517.1 hypothetical protein BGC07_15530 [Piscirickettsia litoralis]
MEKKEATAIAQSLTEKELLPFLRSLEPKMVSDEVFLSFCQTTILTMTKVMRDFCVNYDDFDCKDAWLENVKENIHKGVDKFFKIGGGETGLNIMSKTFFQ